MRRLWGDETGSPPQSTKSDPSPVRSSQLRVKAEPTPPRNEGHRQLPCSQAGLSDDELLSAFAFLCPLWCSESCRSARLSTPRSTCCLLLPSARMPAFKETSIHSSFFPEAGDNERVERVSIVGAPQTKGVKRFLPKRQKSHAPVLRDLGEEGEGAEGKAGPTPPSTQPSTRRSSLTAVGDAAAVGWNSLHSSTRNTSDLRAFCRAPMTHTRRAMRTRRARRDRPGRTTRRTSGTTRSSWSSSRTATRRTRSTGPRARSG